MKFDVTLLLLILTMCLYFAGVFFIHEDETALSNYGIQREHTFYVDREGEEHEEEGLLEFEGIGKVLSYKDIYLSPFLLIIGSVFLAKALHINTNDISCLIYTNCILGFLLIWLTTRSNLTSTILYWLGIISAYFANEYGRKKV